MSKFAITGVGLMKSFGLMPVMRRPLSGFGAAISINDEAIRLSSAPVPRRIQAFSFRNNNKIKTISTADKHSLTILHEQFSADECCEPRG
jgi:hypothetical protein